MRKINIKLWFLFSMAIILVFGFLLGRKEGLENPTSLMGWSSTKGTPETTAEPVTPFEGNPFENNR